MHKYTQEEYNERMRRSRFLPEFLEVCGMEFTSFMGDTWSELYGRRKDRDMLDRNLRLLGFGTIYISNDFLGPQPPPPPPQQRFWLTEEELSDPGLRNSRLADLQPHMQRDRTGSQACACIVCIWDRDWKQRAESGELEREWRAARDERLREL